METQKGRGEQGEQESLRGHGFKKLQGVGKRIKETTNLGSNYHEIQPIGSLQLKAGLRGGELERSCLYFNRFVPQVKLFLVRVFL